ncbi:hypothetical protein [uncultured Prochlorococcus sp.]|uniref:hypothetical protein n=1 Tax=uncultured Prochlorococcus sp. TaxID=159733 RepID=UPI00258BA483|nr:hypothetical protein [uncultured Prochlorococcus sp.]
MTKRLTEKQKEEIVKSFKSGIGIDVLSENFNCTIPTIIRNLKKSLGDSKYKKFLNTSKSLEGKSRNNKNQTNDLFKTNCDEADLVKESNDPKILKQNITTSNFTSENYFLEIAPIDYEIDNSSRKDLSSVPISEVDLPKVVYMIVDKKIELEIKFLKDFPEWDFLPHNDLNRKAIEIFFDLNIAKRSCNKEQKVLKVPNTDVFRIAARFLVGKGISRIVYAENLIAL